MHGKEGDNLIIIDFEYAMPTTRGFDLANFFNEFCFDYDSSQPEIPDESKYPGRDRMIALLKQYVKDDDADELIEDILYEVQVYRPIVNLLWGHWGLVKASETSGASSFDYLLSSKKRYELFVTLAQSLNY